MANVKKYLSKIVKSGTILWLKDAEARETLEGIPSVYATKTELEEALDGKNDIQRQLLEKNVILENDGELYHIKDNSVYPVAHPDLSTQPSVLPQRFGNLPVKEVLIANGRENEIPFNVTVIEAWSFNKTQCVAAFAKRNTTNRQWSVTNDKGIIPDFTLIRYIDSDNDYYDYGYGYGDDGGKVISVDDFSLYGKSRIILPAQYSYRLANILPANYNTDIASLSASVYKTSTGSVSVAADGTAGVILTVASMPIFTEYVNLSVTATFTDGNSITADKYIILNKDNSIHETAIAINQGTKDAIRMITSDPDATSFAIWLRKNTHRYLGKKTADGQMTICQLKDDDSTKYADGSAAVLNGTEGDVFVRLPEFYYRCETHAHDTDKWTIYLAWGSKPDNTYKTWNDGRLLGAYEAYMTNNKLYSRSGVQSAGNINRDNFKTYARARGTGYSLVTWEWHCIMAVLYYALYGHTNCQHRIGKGTNAYNKVTGQTNSLGMEDTVAGGNGETMSINFLGAENWWGNKYEFIDNADVLDYVWTITDIENGNTTRNAGTGASSNNWISKMVFGEFVDLIPTAVAGSETTGFCDYYEQNTGSRVVLRSCNDASASGGVAYVAAIYDSSDTVMNVGSRLAFSGVIVEASDVATFKAIQVTN